MTDLTPLVAGFQGKRVLIVGDLMLDEYLWGEVHRISPEAPVPVVRLKRSTLAPGGAGNVVTNVAALGGLPMIHTVVGQDTAGDQLLGVLDEQGIPTGAVERDPERPTTVKTRIIAHAQQVVRADREDDRPLDPEVEEKLLERLRAEMERTDAVVLSDYAKGVLTSRVIQETLSAAAARHLPSVVDPAYGDVSRYQPVTTLKLNFREALAACGRTGPALDQPGGRILAEQLGRQLVGSHDLRAVVITCGPEGMVLVAASGEVTPIAAAAREVYDVTGAGDTVTAAFALALAAGASLAEAAHVSNQAAAVVVGKVGTAVVSAEELRSALS